MVSTIFFSHGKAHGQHGLATEMSMCGCQTVKFLARFPSAQSSLIDQFLRRFSDQFAALPMQFSKKGLQILLLPTTEQFQYNPCSSDLCMDGLMKQDQE